MYSHVDRVTLLSRKPRYWSTRCSRFRVVFKAFNEVSHRSPRYLYSSSSPEPEVNRQCKIHFQLNFIRNYTKFAIIIFTNGHLYLEDWLVPERVCLSIFDIILLAAVLSVSNEDEINKSEHSNLGTVCEYYMLSYWIHFFSFIITRLYFLMQWQSQSIKLFDLVRYWLSITL